jgi:hypothetical protein
MWLVERDYSRDDLEFPRNCPEGFYIFGGADEKGVVHNDLWLARPNYTLN